MRLKAETSELKPANFFPSELFMNELECLAYFNHFITFPFLNCVKTSSQAELLVILSQFYSDLSDKMLRQQKVLFQFIECQYQNCQVKL